MVERKFPRFTVELPCVYSKDNGPALNGTTVNLSRGGCAIRCSTPIEKGDCLKVLIFPSVNQSPIEVGLAPVQWAASEQFGVEFITLLASDSKRLHDLLMVMESPNDMD